MKTFNLIACIIILLLAAVSAVFSYFLYEKRVQFVNGWSQMATAIETSAKTIDQKGEKKFASQLTKSNLEHKAYSKSPEEFNNKLKNLDAQSKAFVSQYERLEEDLAAEKQKVESLNKKLAIAKTQISEMSNTFNEIAGRCGAPLSDTDKRNLQNPETYQGVTRNVRERVNDVVANRENIAKILNSIDKEISINKNTLFSSPAAGLAPLKTVFNKYRNRSIVYGNTITTIGKLVGKNFVADNNNNAIINEIRNRQNTLAAREKELQAKGVEINRLNATINKQNNTIRGLNSDVADLKRCLDLDPSAAVPRVFARGSEDARKEVQGKVIEVSDEYGYVVINVGADTTITQTIGNKVHTINPELKENLNFRVSRDGKIITTVTLSEVGAKESTANIPLSKTGAIKVGDDVVYGKAE